MKTISCLSVLACVALAGCGVRFGTASVNAPVPDSFKERALYPAGVAGYEFQDLVGVIISTKKNQNPVPVGLIRPTGFNSVVIPITDPNNYYKSRVQKGAEVGGSYLAFAADFKADQMAELELSDVARAGILFKDTVFQEILNKATRWVTAHPKPANDTATTRLWIKAVVLTRRTYTDFTNISANAKGQVTPAVGVSTGTYSNTENYIKSVVLAFEAFDIDKLVAQSSTIESIGGSSDDKIRFAKHGRIIGGEIKPDGTMLKKR